jgi:hypothetical protein
MGLWQYESIEIFSYSRAACLMELNALGQAGWELVSMAPSFDGRIVGILKRPILLASPFTTPAPTGGQ